MIYTVGYGGRTAKRFIQLLREHGIELVVDVRRFPTSKKEEFKRENLEAMLRENGIGYVWLGDLLGGFRRGGYEKYAKSDKFNEGINKLLELAEGKNIASMCLERNVKYCHRRFIVQRLEEIGVEVVNL